MLQGSLLSSVWDDPGFPQASFACFERSKLRGKGLVLKQAPMVAPQQTLQLPPCTGCYRL